MRSRMAPALVLSLTWAGWPVQGAAGQSSSALAVRITSPLGRTGLVERVRIVAQVSQTNDRPLQAVKFYVDDNLLGADEDGPPYAVEWTDENPFEPRDIAVEVSDVDGTVARDHVRLEPLRINETSEVSSVVLDVSVYELDGRFVGGLGPADFHLLEDGVAQQIDVVSPERLPATFTLLIDSSQSMARRIDAVKDAAAAFVRYLRRDDRIIVAPFSRTLGPVTGPTTDHRTVDEAIESIGSSGGTAILNALRIMADRLDKGEGRQAIVLLTDGYDEHSTIAMDDALAAVRKLHAPVYVIGMAGSAGISLNGERFLRGIAAQTGGRAFFPSRESEHAAMDKRVAEEIQQRYVIAYTPTNQRVDGAWRRIELTTVNRRWVVRSRGGYFAPTPPPIRPSLEFTMMNTRRELLAVSIDDLMVREDGIEQAIDTFEEAVSPVSMVLAIDASGSMKKQAEEVKAAARSFVAAIRPEDKLSVTSFGDSVWFHHDFSTQRAWSYAAIDHYRAAGGTALYDDLYYAFTRLGRVSGRRVAVVVTDGRDENNPGTAPGSVHTREEVIDLMKQADVTVFAIGIGPNADRAVLAQFATESGGEALFPSDVNELDAQYRRVVENLRRRYVISYTSTNPTRDGAWRSIEIVSGIPDTTVVSKGGYFAPER